MFTKKNSLLVVLIAGLLVFASSCKQPSSGSSETSVKSWENLKDVLDAGEDLSGTWTLTDAYLKIYNSKDGKPDPDNFESSDIDEILAYQDKDGKTNTDMKEFTFKTKEEAEHSMRFLIDDFEEASKERQEDFKEMENGFLLAQLFGFNIDLKKNKKSSETYIKINKDRNNITLYDAVDVELAGSMTAMGETEKFDYKGNGKAKFVYIRKEN